jgi:hypothetical protein
MDQFAKTITALDNERLRPCRLFIRWPATWWLEVQAAVCPVAVVMINEDAQGALKMTRVHDQQPVQALGSNRPNEAFPRSHSPAGPEWASERSGCPGPETRHRRSSRTCDRDPESRIESAGRLTCRRSTASSCRRTTISSSLNSVDRNIRATSCRKRRRTMYKDGQHGTSQKRQPKESPFLRKPNFRTPHAHPLPDGPWVFQRQALEAPAAATLVARVRDRNHQAAIPNSQQRALVFSRT